VDEAPVATTTEAFAGGTVINVPVYFHFLYDHVDAATGLPAYKSGSASETILDLDAALATGNAALDAAAPSDGRRLHLVRIGVEYEPAPSTCPDPKATIDPHRVFGAINVVASPLCGGVTTLAYANRANAGALIHEIGHALGLQHTFNNNTDANQVELLDREPDPTNAQSCYRRGDFTCDTPPDYGYVGYNTCSVQIPGLDLCTQIGSACNPNDPVIDGKGVCTPYFMPPFHLGKRVYDPAKLGLYPSPAPGNIMAYWTQSFFTPEQFLRMHNYVDWRLGLQAWVPASEKPLRFGFWGAPSDPIWSAPVDADHALTNAVSAWYTDPSTRTLPATLSVNNAPGAGRRVLGVRVSANVTGTPSANLKITVTPPRGAAPAVVAAGSIRVAGGQILADEAFATPGSAPSLATLRGLRSQGAWSVRVEDTAPIRVTNLSLTLVDGDRAYLASDRQARGVSDVMVYRPSAQALWTSYNEMNGAPQFAGGVYDGLPVPPSALLVPGTQYMGGDVDGDGATDLVGRNAGTIAVAFARESYATWHAGSIAGSDLPFATDEVLMGDFDGDGIGDLMRRRPIALINTAVWRFHRGNGDGTFGPGVPPVIGANDVAYAANMRWTVGDLNGDGRSDLLVRYEGSGLFWTSINVTPPPTTSGVTPTFYGGFNPTFGGSMYAYADADRFALMDVNQDGMDDLVARRSGTGQWFASINQTGTALGAPIAASVGGGQVAYLDSDTILGALP
jgi:subtilisin-like proprotein convertase family protein